jgi:HK97 family phage major capsid protein
MPYSKVEGHSECSDGEVAVVKDEDGEVMGCHGSDEAADEQIAALNASEAEEKAADVKMLGPEESFAVVSTSEEGEEGYFYPVFMSRRAAQGASFTGEVHEHEFEGFAMTLYMPEDPQVHAAEEAPDLPIIPSQTAMKAAAAEAPGSPPEAKADVEDLSEGDLVQWDSSGGLAYGRIDEIAMEGSLESSLRGEPMEASEESPAVRIELVDGTEDGVEGRGETVLHRPGTLSTISAGKVPQKSVPGELLEEALAAPGGEAKAMEDGRVGGYLIRFTKAGDTDIDGDFFTEETDFGPRKSTTVLYHHGQDKTLGRRVLDPGAEIKMDETGVWVEAQLDRRDQYEEAIYQMAKAGKLGWSSGTASHLVERERAAKGGYHVKSWHLGVDASLTPTPVEPRNEAVPVKSIKSTDLSSTDIAQEAKAQQAKAQEGASGESHSSSQQTTRPMSDQTEDETKSLSPLEEYKAGLITKNEYREAKGLDPIDGGDVTADETAEAKAGGPNGGKTVTTQNEAPGYNEKTGLGDTPAKAFKHWAMHGDASGLPAAMVGGEARPDEVKSAKLAGATKVNVSPKTDEAFKSMKADQDMLAGTDAQGGNAVPEGHFNNIIARRDEMMLAERLGVRNIPGQGTTVDVPVDDNTDEEFTQTAEAAQNDRDTPTISNVAMTLDKYTKRVPLTNELMQDEASRLMSFIEDYVGRGQAKTHNNLLVTEVASNGTAFTTFSGTSSIAFGEPEDILADDDLGFYLDDSESVSWVTRNSTLWSIKSLTGNDRQYDRGLLNQGDGKELLGYPVETSNKVDSLGTTNKPLLFGNFNFVGMREDPGFTVLRDPYSRAEEGIVQLHYYFRTVYKVLQSEAVGYGQNA